MQFHQFDQLVEQAYQLVQMGGWVSLGIAVVCGLALTYAGIKIYWLGVFLSGMLIGGLSGLAIATASGANEAVLAIEVVACAIVGGFLAVLCTGLAVFFLGMLAGALLAIAGGVNEPIIVFLSAAIGGGIAIGLYNMAIVFSTALSGAILLSWAFINTISMYNDGSMAYAQHSLVSYGNRIANTAMHSGSVDRAVELLSSDFLLFSFLLLSGIVVQFNFDRIVLALAFRGKNKAASLPRKPQPVSAGMRYSTFSKSIKSRVKEERQRVLVEPVKTTEWFITLFENGERVKEYRLVPGEYSLGRDSEADFILNDAAVSRRHLSIRLSSTNQLTIEDLQSSNGTWKSGKERISTDNPDDGCWYQMGRAQILFKKQ